MLQSFFKAAVRNLRKNKQYLFINVLGLALGVSCCLIIFVIVRYETSFDDFHSKADRIYRVNLNQKTPHGTRLDGCNYTPLAEAIRSEVTGLDGVTGVFCLHAYQFSVQQNLFEDKYAFFADPEYLKVFDVEWIAGNPKQALTLPNSTIVTDAFAEKFLGGINSALDTTFLFENRMSLTVVGIVRKPPSNTDHPYSMLISYSSLAEYYPESIDNWEDVRSGATYIALNQTTKPDQIYPQLNKIIQKHLKKEVASNTQFFLMRLNDNHDRNYDYNSFTYDFPVPVMVILSIIAGMIAFIACINFVNLATAQSLKRAREVGIRKTMGSSRVQLILQYMSEAFVITLLAVLAGIILANIGMLQLNKLYGGNYLEVNLLTEPFAILFITAITITISFLAGFYPAFVLSGFRPVLALKSQTNTGRSKGFPLRRGLVILQFIGAQVLILVTVIMINQISHFKERPLTFDPDTILVLPHLRGNEKQQHEKLGQALKKVPGIIDYTFAFGTPMGGDWLEFSNKGDDANKHTGMINYVDASYLSTFKLELIAGKNFSPEVLRASSEVLVNEKLIKTLEMESPHAAIGAIFNLGDQELMIRGVIKDFYTQQLSSKIDPVIMQYNPNKTVGVAINVTAGNIPQTIEDIGKAWKVVYPDYLFKYHFMEDSLNRQFGFFNTIFSFLGTAAFLTIFIGCLGLYGLVSFMAVQRTKEIGIRKVFGATISNIMMMFSKESAVLIVIAFMAAAPLANWLGTAMLSELPERVEPGIEIFLITLFASLLIALLTVAYRSFTAAIQNPMDSLRTE